MSARRGRLEQWTAARRVAAFVLAFALPLVTGVRDAAAFHVTGGVFDVNLNLVPGIRVSVYDEDVGADPLLGTGYTDAVGRFDIDVTDGWGPLEADPDIFVVVDWAFRIAAPAATSVQHFVLVQTNPAADPFNSFAYCEFDDHDATEALECGGAFLQDGLNPARANVANLTRLLQQALDYYANRKGTVAWSANYDVPINIRTDSATSFEQAQAINIADVDINAVVVAGIGKGWQSDLYHETAHLVHDRAHGAIPPDGQADRNHTSNSEKGPVFALTEGWASHVQDRTDILAGHANDGKVSPNNRDPARTNWRGGSSYDGDGMAEFRSGATGREGATFESGEEVEGSLGGVFYDFQLDATFGGADNFAPLFRVFVEDTPNDLYEFVDGLVNDLGPGGAASDRLYEILQRHGIVWTRAIFNGSGFVEISPPDDADAATPGNRVAEEHYTYLRGLVHVRAEKATMFDLGVARIVNALKARVGHKRAFPELVDPASLFSDFSEAASFAGILAEVPVDTVDFSAERGDGDWDLLIRTENTDGFEDSLLPSWTGDFNTTVNSDEKALKRLGAWYDFDTDPVSHPDIEGMVIVDNTSPTIDPASFEPK